MSPTYAQFFKTTHSSSQASEPNSSPPSPNPPNKNFERQSALDSKKQRQTATKQAKIAQSANKKIAMRNVFM